MRNLGSGWRTGLHESEGSEQIPSPGTVACVEDHTIPPWFVRRRQDEKREPKCGWLTAMGWGGENSHRNCRYCTPPSLMNQQRLPCESPSDPSLLCHTLDLRGSTKVCCSKISTELIIYVQQKTGYLLWGRRPKSKRLHGSIGMRHNLDPAAIHHFVFFYAEA